MELLGLAFVIVIILFGLLLVYRFFLTKEQTNPTREALDTHLSTNLVDTILDTTTPCSLLTIAGMLRECGKGSFITCNAYSASVGNPNDLDPIKKAQAVSISIPQSNVCAWSFEAIKFMLSQTLGKMQREYSLNVETCSGQTLCTQLTNFPLNQYSAGQTGCDAGYKKVERRRTDPQSGMAIKATLLLCQ
jgi:hypothetical protein